jgi:hypothetical protein
VTITVTVRVVAGPLSALTTRAARQLLDSGEYVRAVIGDGVPRAAR